MTDSNISSDKHLKTNGNEGKVYTWRRASCYVFKDTGKFLIVKTICDIMNNKPLNGETMIACYEIAPGQMADMTIDRVITVDGVDGCLTLCDSNIYIEFKKGVIVGGDVQRVREVIPTSASTRNGKKMRIGHTVLREIVEGKDAHLSMRELSETLEKLGVVGFHAKKALKEVDDNTASTSKGASKKHVADKSSDDISVDDEYTELVIQDMGIIRDESAELMSVDDAKLHAGFVKLLRKLLPRDVLSIWKERVGGMLFYASLNNTLYKQQHCSCCGTMEQADKEKTTARTSQ